MYVKIPIILIFHIYIIIVNKKKDTSFTLFKILNSPNGLKTEEKL